MKLALNRSEDLYDRIASLLSSIKKKDDNSVLTAKQFKLYKIKRLLNWRGNANSKDVKYLVKWKDYSREYNV